MSNAENQKEYLPGSAGREQIKRMMSMGNPKQAILEFGANNGLDIPAASTVYALLDSLGHKRRDIHAAVLNSVVDAAIAKVKSEKLAPRNHSELLETVKGYLSIPQLRKIPLTLLSQRPRDIPDFYFKYISKNPDVYEECAFDVKREIWRRDSALFRAYMGPLIERYCKDEFLASMAREISNREAEAITKRRRHHTAFTEIIDSIDADLQLYMTTLAIVREQFLETQDPALGTLRLDLIMCMHESDVTEIVESDPCHGLAWSLDACIMKQSMDERRVLELQKYFDSIDTDNPPYGEIALILCSPYARHILAHKIFSILEEIAHYRGSASKYALLKWPSQMLTIGLSAHYMLSQEMPDLPTVDHSVQKTFYPAMVQFISASMKHGRSSVDLGGSPGGVKRSRRNSYGSPSRSTGRRGSADSPPHNDISPAIEGSSNQPGANDFEILSTSELARQVLYVFLLKRMSSYDVGMVNSWLSDLSKIMKRVLNIPGNVAKAEIPPTSRGIDITTGEPALSANAQESQMTGPHNLYAFEMDAFVQSLITQIRNTSGLCATITNAITDNLDQVDGKVDRLNIPLLNFLDQIGQIRHIAHEQVIMLLNEIESCLVYEYNGGVVHAENGSTISIHSKENAVIFVFEFAERVAEYYVVDSDRIGILKQAYARLEANSPQQAFKYRISRLNCHHALKFFS